jgi:hypothetical protein
MYNRPHGTNSSFRGPNCLCACDLLIKNNLLNFVAQTLFMETSQYNCSNSSLEVKFIYSHYNNDLA